MKAEEIEVSAYSGYKLCEKPLKFIYKSKEFTIDKILNRTTKSSFLNHKIEYWFKVLCKNKKSFTIFYDIHQDKWFISLSHFVHGHFL